MRALTFVDIARVVCDEVADAKIEDPRDVLVQVERTAICGSDLHVYRGGERGLDVGTVLGHEFQGRVLERGADVTCFEVGDSVCAPFTTSCGHCRACRRGLTSRCIHGQLFGWVQDGHGLHGAQAELVRVPLADSTLVTIPAGVDEELAVLAGDVFATGSYCAERAGVGPGHLIVVIGCGPVGLCAILAALARGAEQVLAVDSVAERLALAEAFGAQALEPAAAMAAVRRASEGEGADAVLECVGSPEATRAAFELLRPGGTLSAVGVHTEAQLAFSPGEAYDKNLSYVAGRCPARQGLAERLVNLQRCPQDLRKLFSHRLPLSEGPEAYRLFDAKLDGCTKALLFANSS